MNKKFSIEVLVVGLANFFLQLQALLLLPIISHVMGIETYGIWVQITVVITLFTGVFGLGLHIALIRFTAGESDTQEIGRIFWTILGLAMVSATIGVILLFMSASFLANLLGVPDASVLFALGGIAVWFGIVNAQFLNYYRARRQMSSYSWFLLVNSLSDALLVAGVVWFYQDIKAAVISLGVGRMLLAWFHGIKIGRQIGWHRPQWRLSKGYLAYCVPTTPNLLYTWVLDKSDRFLIGFFAGPAAVGVYSAAYSLCGAIQMGIRTLYQTLFPALTEFWVHNKHEEVKEYLHYALKYFQLFAIPAIFGLIVLAYPLLVLLIGEDSATQGADLVPWIAFGIFFFGMQIIYGQVLYVAKRTNILAMISLGAGVINVLLNIWLIPLWGVLGAAVTTFVSYLFVLLVTAVVSHRYLATSFPYRDTFKIIISASLMTLCLLAIKSEIGGVLYLGIAVIFGGAIYLASLLLLRVFSSKEVGLFWDAFTQVYYRVRRSWPAFVRK
ncbi:MAG TPA: flippase [Chloroflexota bacterium]|nr:flippase [Chloroflexota bacterium]HUM67653.1 flippase [Chloroflexota bacterium]